MVDRDEILAEWDRAVDDLVGRIRKGAKAKLRDALECGAFDDIETSLDDVKRRPYYWPRIILWLYVLDQSAPPASWKADVEKLKPSI